MDIRCAPMEGLTDPIFRRVHRRFFSGVSAYYIPFISPTQHHVLTPKEARMITPDASYRSVPQVMTHNADDFLWAAGVLMDLGYDEVNLNIGCPAGTVTAKTKGSGLLRAPDVLRALLDGICSTSPLPVSVKTRIGFESPEEWPALWELLQDYPLREIIIHPRTRREFYKGGVHMDCFRDAAASGLPLCYNGNLFTPDECAALLTEFPGMPIMLGRGLIANPALARQISGGSAPSHDELRRFHDTLQAEYSAVYPADQVHIRLRGIMKYVSGCFDDAAKAYKALCKSTPATYDAAVSRLFSCPLKEIPAYDHEGKTN